MPDKQTKPSAILLIKPLLMVIFLALDIYILVTTLNMQKPDYECKCAQKWYLKQVSSSIITVISLQLTIFVLALLIVMMNSRVLLIALLIFVIILAIAQLYYIIMMITMITELDKQKCLCVDPNFKSVMTYYAGIRAFITGLIIIGFVIGMATSK
jgi:hypothetical protein